MVMGHCYIYNNCGQGDGKMRCICVVFEDIIYVELTDHFHLDVMFATVLCLGQ